jgi:hypothetical protein
MTIREVVVNETMNLLKELSNKTNTTIQNINEAYKYQITATKVLSGIVIAFIVSFILFIFSFDIPRCLKHVLNFNFFSKIPKISRKDTLLKKNAAKPKLIRNNVKQLHPTRLQNIHEDIEL